MCGICGIWSKPNRPAIEAMVMAMHHRGPDDCGTFYDDQIGLGMSRLAIIDLSPGGHQPMSTPDKRIWVVFNGEIYNFQDEKRLLEAKGVNFVSNSDTEVILRLYESYGEDFLPRLRGMFALAIYDKRRGTGKERLLLARDPLGIKPLLYTQTTGQLIFASEIKALLASGMVTRDVEPQALRQLLSYGSIYQPLTMIRGVKMLLPAHYLLIENNQQRLIRYWQFGLDRIGDLRTRPYNELVEIVAAGLQESVQYHMVSDVPVGAFLSGGVDSSLLVGLMTHLAGNRIKTFSVGFEAGIKDSPPDETDEAERTASFLGSEHTRVIVTADDVNQHIKRIAIGLDQPTVDGVNSYFVSLAAGQGVKVAVSGTGGDELFAGYPWFAQMARYEAHSNQNRFACSLQAVREKIIHHSSLDRFAEGDRGAQFINWRSKQGFLARYAETYRIFGPLGAAQLIAVPLRKEANIGTSPARELHAFDELGQAMAVERVSALVMRGYLCNQLLRDIDTASMAHSLEVRVPFLDIPMVNLALSLPVDAKLGNVNHIQNPHAATYAEMGSKRILIDAGKHLGILRKDIADQPKRGFTLPFDTWLQGSLHSTLADCLSPQTVRERGLLDEKEASKVHQMYLANRSNWVYPWLLMMLELWCREVLDPIK